MPNYHSRISEIRNEIDKLSVENNFNAQDIKILAASKYACAEELNEVLKCGIDFLGENRVQSFLEKYEKVSEKDKWHFIGQLQTNKVKMIIDKVRLIHSLDRISLAKEIDRRAKAHNIIMDTLVELNVTENSDRGGLHMQDAERFIETISKDYPRIKIVGLMTVLPEKDNFSEIDKICFEIGQFYDKLKDRYSFRYLSMGMSGDYHIALRHGANLLRIGSKIFTKPD